MKYEEMILGAIPSPPDARDYSPDRFGVAMASNLPDEYVIPYITEPYNQGPYGQCL